MTKEERFKKALDKVNAKKEKERQKKRDEMEKKRRRGYKKWLTQKHKEMELEKKRKEREKEREKARREKEKLKKKRRPGRPRKPGPKKKRKYVSKKQQIKAPRPVISYKVVLCLNGRQNGYCGAFYESSGAFSMAEKIVEESNDVVFERKVLAGGNEAIDEILVLEKDRTGEAPDTILRNEYGKLVEQKTNRPKWKIIEKFRYKVEETVWVYGFDQRSGRKTLPWIYENIILERLKQEYENIRVMVYLNKIILKYDDGDMDIVFCKTMPEAIRFYNTFSEYSGKLRNRKIFFIGSYSELSDKRRKLEGEIMEKTGWSKEQIRKRKTKK